MDIKSVIVLGSARSGTSMTAGILSILGVKLGYKTNDLSQNPKGNFENPFFIEITSKMHIDFKKGRSIAEIDKEYGEKISELTYKFKSPLWGFKSALSHHFTDIIIPKLPNPYLVIVFRNDYHNAMSWKLQMRDIYGENVSIDHALHNISESHMDLVKNTSKYTNKIFTTYEDIKKNPWKEACKMAEFLGIEATSEHQKMVEEFIMPEYTTLVI